MASTDLNHIKIVHDLSKVIMKDISNVTMAGEIIFILTKRKMEFYLLSDIFSVKNTILILFPFRLKQHAETC